MNFKKILFSVLLAAGCFSASAQQAPQYTDGFKGHWFVEGQIGGQFTVGEIGFGNLLSPNVQVGAGYQFTPAWALRLSVNAWQSKAGSRLTTGEYNWKWNMVSPMLDVKCDLVNLIGGYKPGRLVGAGLLAGIGANIAWGNDDAYAVNDMMGQDHGFPAGSDVAYLRNLWDGSKALFTGRVGAFVDFHVSQRVDLGIEVNANTLSDKFNSKKAGNSDWYVNGLLGVKVRLGKTTKKVLDEKAPCEPVVVEKVVEKIVEKPVEKIVYREPKEVKPEPLRRDIFFVIRGSEIAQSEMSKVQDVVDYLNKYPQAKVTITGYADKGTGNAKLNYDYAKKRAQKVADVLTKKHNIAAGRVIVDSKGDTEQPYSENEKNRVSICIAE